MIFGQVVGGAGFWRKIESERQNVANLTVNSEAVADVQVEQVVLRRLIGAYELLLAIQGTTYAKPNNPCWLALHGAQVCISPVGGPRMALGMARPDRPERIQQSTNQVRVSAELKIVLQPRQVMAIEDLCNAQDMQFDLVLIGEGGGNVPGDHRFRTNDTLSKQLPRSAWINQLRDARALDIVVVEVPMPVADPSPEQRKIVDHLKRAEKMALDGNYPECVAHCRDVMDAVDSSPSAIQRYTQALKKLNEPDGRKNMSKEDREIAILAAVRNYTHLAHHQGGSGGTEYFTRSEAQLIFTLSATLVARRFSSAPSSAH